MAVNSQKKILQNPVLAKMNSFKVRGCFRMPDKYSVKPKFQFYLRMHRSTGRSVVLT